VADAELGLRDPFPRRGALAPGLAPAGEETVGRVG
jgi:hypothetical protein